MKMTREEFLKPVRSMEVLAVATIGFLGFRNWDQKRTYHRTNSSNALVGHVETDPVVSKLSVSLTGYVNSLSLLRDEYASAYRHVRMVPVVVPSGKGRVTIQMRPETYWSEEKNIPKHSEIDQWLATSKILLEKGEYLKTPELIDITRLQSVAIKAEKGDATSQKILTTVIYGTLAGATLMYEEAFALLTKGYSSYQESLESISLPHEVKRRDVIKLISGLAGVLVASGINYGIDQSLSQGEKKLKTLVTTVDLETKLTASQLISNYFERDLGSMISLVESQINTSADALGKGVSEAKVSGAMKQFQQSASELSSTLKEIANNSDFNEALGYYSACGTATQKLSNASAGEERLANMAVVFEGLGVTTVMGLLITLGERYNLSHR